MKSPSKPVVMALVPAAAATLSLVRWLWQGTGNVWSKLDHKLYLADADLGWRRTDEGHTWLGLDLIAILVATAVGLYIVGRILENRSGSVATWIGRIAGGIMVAALVIPLYAVAGGPPPTGARESRPTTMIEAPTAGVTASLVGLPSGRYVTVEHRDSAVIAKLKAGGEVFDARFAGGLEGYWIADPSDLSQPMQVQVGVNAASIDTGIELRNQHALDDLKPAEFPRVMFKLTQLHSTESTDGKVAFAASGALTLGGRMHPVDVVGTLRAVDPTLAKKLGLSEGQYVLLQSGFSLNLKETIIGNDGTFDVDDVPVSVTLILKHSEHKS